MSNHGPVYVSGAVASAGDQALIAAPGAGLRLRIHSVFIQNETSSPTTVIFKEGSTARLRCYNLAAGDGHSFEFPPEQPLILATNTALTVNLSGAYSHGYTVCYETEVVR